ncbi:MAG: hypothetical protein WC052_05880 [Patescibacteria group bacterium]|jgi:hypothetical protein
MTALEINAIVDLPEYGTPPDINFVISHGYYTFGDGGGGCYARVASPPAVGAYAISATGGVFALLVSGEVNIKQFGASSNIADNGPLINAAIAFAGSVSPGMSVVIPAGNYNFSTPIVDATANPIICDGTLVFIGSGANAVTIGANNSLPVHAGAVGYISAITRINVKRSTQNFSDQFAGIVFKNLYPFSAVVRVDSFYEGVVVLGDTVGSAFNKIEILGAFGCLRAAVVRTIGNAGFSNSHRITMGNIEARPTITSPQMAAAVFFDMQGGQITGTEVIGGGYEILNLGSGGSSVVYVRVGPNATATLQSNKISGFRHENLQYLIAGNAAPTVTNGGTTNGTNVVAMASVTGISVGASVVSSASGDIPSGAYVTGISGLNVTLSARATGSNSNQDIVIATRNLYVDSMLFEPANGYMFLDNNTQSFIGGDTPQDKTSFALASLFRMDKMHPERGNSWETLASFGRRNVVDSASGVQAPARGVWFDIGPNAFGAVKTSVLKTDEIQISADMFLGFLVDVRSVSKDLFRKLSLFIEHGSAQAGYPLVIPYDANGVRLTSFGDTQLMIGAAREHSIQVRDVVKNLFRTTASLSSASQKECSISYGADVKFIFIAYGNLNTSPAIRSMSISAPFYSGAKVLYNSSVIPEIASIPLIDTDDIISTEVPNAPTATNMSQIGAVVRNRAPAVGSPTAWWFDTTETWRAGVNL